MAVNKDAASAAAVLAPSGKKKGALDPSHILGEDTAGGVVDVTPAFGALAAFEDGSNIERLPEVVYARLEAIQTLQEEFDELQKQHIAEMKLLEQKYHELYLPVLAKRSDIVSGRIDPALTRKQEQAEAKAKADAEEAELNARLGAVKLSQSKPDEGDVSGGAEGGGDAGAGAAAAAAAGGAGPAASTETALAAPLEIPESEKQVTGIPGFWLQTMKNHQEVSQLVDPNDEDCLKYLVDVRSEFLDEMKGFRLAFHFARNPYFLNSEITKEYHIENFFRGEQTLVRVTGTEINWKRGKNLTVKRVKRKTKRGKTIMRTEKADSFFHFFYDPMITTVGEDEDEEEVYQQIDADFETGLTFKDKLIPNAFRWYTGEAADSDSDSDFSDPGDDDDDDDSDSDSDDSSDDEDEDKPEELEDGEDPAEKEEIKAALAEALAAKKSQPGALGSAEGTTAQPGTVDDVEKPDDCKTQ